MEKRGPEHRRGKRRLRIIKELVSSRQYNYSKKVQSLIEDAYYALEDLERCILSARTIEKVEPDELGTAIDGCKYTIICMDTQGRSFYTCGKLIRHSESEKLYFFITAHEEGFEYEQRTGGYGNG
jgi:hypothetical protein